MLLEISVVVLSIAFLIIALLSIPFLLQIWRTAKSMAETLHMLNESLPHILKNLDEITTNINKATRTANEQIEGLAVVARRVQGLLGMVADVENIFHVFGTRVPVVRRMRNALAILTGVKVFLKVFLSSPKCE
ncbi:MAG TPA: DUF948 domain-containing protein [Syntrophales bacterium]|nr:DUF948 domain-containing protein [Syntrophales bacterium]